MTADRSHRGTIFVEDAEVLEHQHLAAEQHVIRLRAPETAARARPGQFVHLECDPLLRMRRPFSIMRADAKAGWIDVLYKVVGQGTALLARRARGESLSLLGPIGVPFVLHPERPRPLLVGGGVGIPPMVFVAEAFLKDKGADRGAKRLPFVVMGSEVPFPFTPKPSQFMVAGVGGGATACMPLLEDWGIPSRLASQQGYPGCFDGFVTDLARGWLGALDASARAEVEVLACGPTPMLKAVAALAREFDLPCQVSLEEHMACAVGGCAGCAVEVVVDGRKAMKRVCVDGPVFDARQAFYSA
jgi:dihydroorotate dehydrogenase electron transfer subunit